MVEPEMAFYELPDNMQLAEDFLRSIASHLLENCAEDLQFFNDRIDDKVLGQLQTMTEAKEFHRIPYTEAG